MVVAEAGRAGCQFGVDEGRVVETALSGTFVGGGGEPKRRAGNEDKGGVRELHLCGSGGLECDIDDDVNIGKCQMFSSIDSGWKVR